MVCRSTEILIIVAEVEQGDGEQSGCHVPETMRTFDRGERFVRLEKAFGFPDGLSNE